MLRHNVAVLALSTIGLSTSKAETLYSVIDLGVKGRHAINANINNRGQVAFSVFPNSDSDPGAAFVFDGGSAVELGSFGGLVTQAGDINDSGIITGHSYHTDGRSEPFVYQNGQLNGLDQIGERGSIAGAINRFGQIVGHAIFNNQFRGFALLSPDQIVTIPTFGGDVSSASDINDLGQIVGSAQIPGGNSVAFLYENGALTNLGTLGGFFSGAAAINENGVIVGSSDTPDRDVKAFIYRAWYEGMQYLDIENPYSEASDINNHNVVVGRAGNSLEDSRAFVFDDIHGMRFLEELISPQSGWSELSDATGINDRGQIVGLGLINSEIHAFLATPIPEPSCARFLSAASLTVFCVRRRRSNAII